MRVIVIGAGPVGLEAAAAAQGAGHAVTVLEAGRVGEHVGRWGHVTLFTPWRMNTTARGRERVGDPRLGSDTCPTGAELVAGYLAPLAAHLEVREHHRVLGVSRSRRFKGEALGQAVRADDPFRVLVATDAGEHVLTADAVLDCSGVLGAPAPIGAGGLPAPGEAEARAAGRLRYGPVPVDDLAGRRVLLVGNGASAATVLDALHGAGAEITWVTVEHEVPGFVSPPDDPLPGRAALAQRVRDLLPHLTHRAGAAVDGLHVDDAVHVRLTDGTALRVDDIVGCCGYRPDNRILGELQFHVCWGSDGPMKLAAALLASSGSGGDCLARPSTGPDALRSPEPRLFVLGSKSYGRRGDFLLEVGHRQIDDALSLLS